MNPGELEERSRADTEPGGSRLAPVAADLRVGTRLASYDIKAVAGRGGMGVVYRAEHIHLHRLVALKLLMPDLSASEDFRERFVRESQTAAAINHPNIITVYDAGEAEGLPYIAMQYIEGTDMASLLRRAGPLEPPEAVFLLTQVAGALDAAHAHGMVHRDVKPENVLIDRDQHCYLTDFGATKRIAADSAVTAHGQFVGTIDYMAPEQIRGEPLDARTDVYALGCLIYHALAGAPPHARESEVSVIYAHLNEPPPALRAHQPDLPEELDAVVAKAVAKDPDDRYRSCYELITAVRSVTEEDGSPADVVPARVEIGRTKVLLAEEEESCRALMRASLGPGRLKVLEAVDGNAAIATARRERPALAFVDVDIPGRSGADVCRALRADPETAGIRIVGLASRSQAAERRALLAAGADDCIVKPFSPLQLLYRVRDLVGPEVLPA